MAEALKKCRNPGCNLEYLESENTDDSCRYHDGQVIFHDTKKGWACCNRVAYDWDDFQKIVGCKQGHHTDKKQTTDFYKSRTVANAEAALKREDGPKVMTIEEFDKQEAERRAKAAQDPEDIVKNSQGLNVCGNFGCNQAYDPVSNPPDACSHHTGPPMFHDLRKFWTCCKAEAWDWDDFMKLPRCSKGNHMPKYRKKK